MVRIIMCQYADKGAFYISFVLGTRRLKSTAWNGSTRGLCPYTLVSLQTKAQPVEVDTGL